MGLCQTRKRVIIVASFTHDPRPVLLGTQGALGRLVAPPCMDSLEAAHGMHDGGYSGRHSVVHEISSRSIGEDAARQTHRAPTHIPSCQRRGILCCANWSSEWLSRVMCWSRRGTLLAVL